MAKFAQAHPSRLQAPARARRVAAASIATALFALAFRLNSAVVGAAGGGNERQATRITLEAGCLAADAYCSGAFDSLSFPEADRLQALMAMAGNLGIFRNLNINEQNMKAYLKSCLEHMPPNPYHNAAHVFDVTQFMYTLLWQTGLATTIAPTQLFAAFTAAISHDLEHTGTSNRLLVSEQHPYTKEAVGGVGPLECHHANIALNLLNKHHVLNSLGWNTARVVRKQIKEMIHATDLGIHKRVMSGFAAARKHMNVSGGPRKFFMRQGKVDKLLAVMLKVSDVSHTARPDFEVLRQWRMRVHQEFYAEGDRDRAAGRALEPLHDRETNNIIKSTGAFMNFYVGAMFIELEDFFRHCSGTNIPPDAFGWASSSLRANSVRLRKIELGDTTQTQIPLCALASGAVLCFFERFATVGKLLVFFGAHCGLIFCTKIVLSSAIVSDELGFTGLHTPFILAALHQLMVFISFGVVILVKCVSSFYRPAIPQTRHEWFGILVFSLLLALNTGLNNMSIDALPISLNLVIRSCFPLCSIFFRLLHGTRNMDQLDKRECECFLLGASFMVLVIIVQSYWHQISAWQMTFGLTAGALSVLAGSANHIVEEKLDMHMQMDSMSMAFWRAVPTAIFLLLPSFTIPHHAWEGKGLMTEWAVLNTVLAIRPDLLALPFIFGAVATAHSLVQKWLEKGLSASHASVACHANRALAGMLSVLYGVESMPAGWICSLLLLSTFGSIATFAYCASVEAMRAMMTTPRSSEVAMTNACSQVETEELPPPPLVRRKGRWKTQHFQL